MLIVLGAMFALMLGSVWNDSATYDEVEHVGAGFGCITRCAYWLTPEKPPILKSLAALSAQLIVHPTFPTDAAAWRGNSGSRLGEIFLYRSPGNDADRILFWARIPMIVLALGFSAALFFWTRLHFGVGTALLTTLFFAFSPTVLAHARLVTYDMGAAFAFFTGICLYVRFLKAPTWPNLLLCGTVFGGAQLIRFSAALLAPLYALMLFAWVVSLPAEPERWRVGVRLALKTLIIGAAGLLIVWVFYGGFVWNFPHICQARALPQTFPFQPLKASRPMVAQALATLDLALLSRPLLRPLGEVLLGVILEMARAASGSISYFLGRTSTRGSGFYLPALYLFKQPLAFHLLTLLALWTGARRLLAALDRNSMPLGARLLRWIRANFIEFSAAIFITLYWMLAVRSPLNLGIRHALPTFPFIYLLVARNLSGKARPIGLATAGLTIWLVVATVSGFPAFLSFYNLLAGGSANGWKIAVDSNYDWGQDLKRLGDYVADNHISRISVDYFGRADPKYYLHDAYAPWDSAGKSAAHGWFAISATNRQAGFGAGARGVPGPGAYDWLKPRPPFARAGDSIFIYRLP